jgi:protein-tyrosine phosphatase
VPEGARRALAARGIPPFRHKARLATREVLRWADLILVMTADHYDHIVELYPEFSSRTRLLRDAAGFGERDVEDPMGLPDDVFASCLAEIGESLEALLASGFRAPA